MIIRKYKISVIVPSYNSHSTIRDCINSLLNQDIDTDYEIIVIDSSEDEGIVEMLRGLPRVKIYHSEKRLNAGQARNLGVKISKGEILAFIDSDCIAPRDWLKNILDCVKKYPEICGVLGVYTGGRSLVEKISGGEYLEESSIGFYGGFIEGNCAFKREIFERGCSWSERARSQYVGLAECMKSKIKKPVLWNSNLKVLHLGRVSFNKIIKSGRSKFEEDIKSPKLMLRSLLFSIVFLAGFASIPLYLAFSEAKLILLFIFPNSLLTYYVLKDRMLSLRYRVIFLPYLLWLRWLFWFGWIHAAVNKIFSI